MDFSLVDKIIERDCDELIDDISVLVSCRSVEDKESSDAVAGRPFGAGVREALDAALNIADRLGFETRCWGGYYGIADIRGSANADTLAAVLGHLDVVPADSSEWDGDPFTLRIDGDRLYGRGVIDDKGPLLASMYAARALVKAGFVPDKTLRFIMGTNEETRMEGVEEYKRREKLPACGFTPDGHWPVVMGEKGIYQFKFKKSWDAEDTSSLPYLVEISAGSVTNIVPGKAAARFSDGTVIETAGASTHASVPEDGDNAITGLVRKLADFAFAPAGAKEFITQLAGLIADDKFGNDMGLDGSDEYSQTTICPTVLRVNKAGAELTLDMRFRISDSCERYNKLVRELAAREGFELEIIGRSEPLFADKNGKLIQALLGAYREVSGDMAEPLVIGGGTYAKHMPNLVAFGAEPIGEMRAHIANEFIRRSELINAMKIYARAIYALTK